ncbi:hypothetical protein CTheo_4785 [Ceratobasidium theobromae]|uniref:Transposase family Tnp2 protein n=1 Tax=Ceratobasidium theobromae TaxID=1582974 RepID=A0A5N5QJT3_9AGAM|nr:hypothetical protein CTheo_4785 [Ceratobasidium theobromae]
MASNTTRQHGDLGDHILRRLSSQKSILSHCTRANTAEPEFEHVPEPTHDYEPFNVPIQEAEAELNWQLEQDIPEVDQTQLWDRVLQVRTRFDEQKPPTSHEGTNGAGSFVSTLASEGTNSSDDYEEVIYNSGTNGLSPKALLKQDFLVSDAKNAATNLGPENLAHIKTFHFFIQNKPSVDAYEDIRSTFVHRDSRTPLPSLKSIRQRMLALSAIKPIDFDCCKNSCVCYTGYMADLDQCPHCNVPRLNPTGRPWSTFSYIPLIPQLRALYRNKKTCESLMYRANYKGNNEKIEDVFDGDRYKELREKYVTIDGEEQTYRFFEDDREIALGLSVDGMCPFKKRKNSCWPLILVNYNLPPDIRTHLHNIYCVGVIPGPSSPHDINSFLQPLVDELLELAKGVEAVDILHEELFQLRAHLISVFGDIPALSKILEFIGHNGRYPCRFCKIEATRGQTSKGGTHLYCPLYRTNNNIDPLDLPLRTHNETIRLGYHVLNTKHDTVSADRATKCGIKGVSLLSRLPSISIPASFPVEVMHMVWINLVPQLVDLWTGTFNNYDAGIHNYLMDQATWDILGDMCGESGSTIPSSFGCRVPNLKKRSNFIAESWSLWATQLAPNILRHRLKEPCYVHFVRLIRLMKECMDYSLPRSELPRIREELALWVQDYEALYYQHNPERMQTCPVNLHYLLHIADSIQFLGPVWTYWAFPMERYCSFIGASVKSRRYPYANIARRIRDVTQLKVIREIYDLHNIIQFGRTRALGEEKEISKAERVEGYPNVLLLGPSALPLTLTTQLRNQIAKYLGTAFKIHARESRQFIPSKLKQWGRIRITGGGDLIQARGYHKLRMDGRDASFVRYELLVDRLAHDRDAPEDLERQSQYGQLRHIFKLEIPRRVAEKYGTPRQLLLAFILEAPTTIDDANEYKAIWYKGDLMSGEVVDAGTIQCVIGRIYDTVHKVWWLIDRSSSLARQNPQENIGKKPRGRMGRRVIKVAVHQKPQVSKGTCGHPQVRADFRRGPTCGRREPQEIDMRTMKTAGASFRSPAKTCGYFAIPWVACGLTACLGSTVGINHPSHLPYSTRRAIFDLWKDLCPSLSKVAALEDNTWFWQFCKPRAPNSIARQPSPLRSNSDPENKSLARRPLPPRPRPASGDWVRLNGRWDWKPTTSLPSLASSSSNAFVPDQPVNHHNSQPSGPLAALTPLDNDASIRLHGPQPGGSWVQGPRTYPNDSQPTWRSDLPIVGSTYQRNYLDEHYVRIAHSEHIEFAPRLGGL